MIFFRQNTKFFLINPCNNVKKMFVEAKKVENLKKNGIKNAK